LALEQVADFQQIDRLFQCNPAIGSRHAPKAIFEIAPHIQMREQAGLLKNISQPALVRRHETARRLPGRAAYFQKAACMTVQARNGPQQRGFATA
jgi:hypothetical protein